MRLMLVMLCVVCLSGCGLFSNKGFVKASEVKPSINVLVERDNEYIKKDSALSDIQKSQFTTENNVLKAIFEKATEGDE